MLMLLALVTALAPSDGEFGLNAQAVPVFPVPSLSARSAIFRRCQDAEHCEYAILVEHENQTLAYLLYSRADAREPDESWRLAQDLSSIGLWRGTVTESSTNVFFLNPDFDACNATAIRDNVDCQATLFDESQLDFVFSRTGGDQLTVLSLSDVHGPVARFEYDAELTLRWFYLRHHDLQDQNAAGTASGDAREQMFELISGDGDLLN